MVINFARVHPGKTMDILSRAAALVGLKAKEEAPKTPEERAVKRTSTFVEGLKSSDATKDTAQQRLSPAHIIQEVTLNDKGDVDSFFTSEETDAKALAALDNELVKIGLNVLSMRKHIEETEEKAQALQEANNDKREKLANESFDDLLAALAMPKKVEHPTNAVKGVKGL